MPTTTRRAFLSILLCFVGALLSGVAMADPGEHAPPVPAISRLFVVEGHARVTALVFAALVFVAFLVGRYAPQRRKQLRLSVLAFVLFLTCVLLIAGLSAAGWLGWIERLDAVAEFFRNVAAIDLIGIAVFYLALPRVNLVLPNIARDLAVGLAYTGATMAMLHRFGVDASSLFTTSAVASLVIGVSLQPTLTNVFGGIALQLDGSVGEGDWIQLPDKMQGRVRQVRWRYTVVETRNWDTLIIPNSQLLQQNILVLGRREGERLLHRMWVFFNVDFEHAPSRVIDVATAALTASPIEGVAQDPPPNCVCMDLAADGRDSFGYYAVRYWLTDLARDDPTNSLVRSRLFSALQRAGISLARPQSLVHVSKESAARVDRAQAREIARRVEFLGRIEFFRATTPEERQRIAGKLRNTPFCQGEFITRQGAVAHWLYILTSGSAEVTIKGVDGHDKVVAQVQGPSIFGEMSLMTGAPRSASVVATSLVECFRLDRDDFKEILLSRPEVAHDISIVLAQRQTELDAARENLNAEAKLQRVKEAHRRILDSIQTFFGLLDDAAPKTRP